VPRGTEIERKYLLEELPDGADVDWIDEEPIRQGYIALDGDTEVRVRLGAGGGVLAVKRGAGRSRLEQELELDDDRARALWDLTAGRRVEKTRRRTRVHGHVIEVDIYEGDLEGLLVAEVEFSDDAAADGFEPPPWFGREVTEDSAFKNRSLACDGRPEAVA
jgi:CYTH domain-containing protein